MPPIFLAQARPALSPEERAVTAWVDMHNPEAVAALERVVNINSGTQNVAGVRQVGARFKADFDKLGFRTEWIDGSAWHRAGHLVADRAGGCF